MPRSNDLPDPTAAEPKLVEGKYAIIAVLALGLAGALGGWWYRSQLQRRAITLWGPEAAELIQQAPRVELLKLEPFDERARNKAEPSFSAAGVKLALAARWDVSQAPGLIHLRHSLINDNSFLWSAPLDDCQPGWPFALRFTSGERAATLLVDFDCRQALLVERKARISIEPMSKGLASFIRELQDAAPDRP
ncbi:MAG TPA: hypothetical protein VMV10_12120 [Pirellulales bacterium]|nr:hypothetical protein [Pirellulales bacterium]